MAKKSLFLGAVALALLVLFTFAGCSNPATETTYVDRVVVDEFDYPVGTVFTDTFDELVGVLNETAEATNGVTYVAFRAATLTFTSRLIVPANKVVYVEQTGGTHTLLQDIVVEPGGTLVLVSAVTTAAGANDGTVTGKLRIKGLMEVYDTLTVTTSTLDVADYYEVDDVISAVYTVIGKNVSVKAGGTLVLPAADLRLLTDSSTNKFTPAEAWAAAGQGSLAITGPLTNTAFTVEYILSGVNPSATRWYIVTTPGGAPLPSFIPEGAFITSTGPMADTPDHNLTVNGCLIADAATATFKDIVNLTVNGELQANNATFESVENLIISAVNTENASRASAAPAWKPFGGWLGADSATLKKAGNINIGDNGTFISESNAIDLPAGTNIILGKSAAFTASAAALNTFAGVASLFIGPASSVTLTSSDISLAALEHLTVKDSGLLSSPGIFTFKLEEPALVGKNALVIGNYAADAEVDFVYTGDTTLIANAGIGNKYVVPVKSTLTVAPGATLTVPNTVTLDLSALKLPAAGESAPVTISGAIQIASGGSVIGPSLVGLTDAVKLDMYTAFDFGSTGKLLLNWGASFQMGTGTTPGTDVEYLVGANGTAADAFEWCASATDGAQIELTGSGITIRDTPVGAAAAPDYAAVVTVGRVTDIIKSHNLTLDQGITLNIIAATAALRLAGDTAGGAKLLGAGKVAISTQTEIIGGQYGWQAYGGTGFISLGYPANKPTIAATVTGTSFRALGPGATITQLAVATNALIVDANTVIELGGNEQAVGGSIILKNSSGANKTDNAKLTLSAGTSRITTGNTSAAQTSAVVLAADNITAAATSTISAIGVLYLDGDGTVIKATPTVTAVEGKVPVGRLISLEGGASAQSITGGNGTTTVDGTVDGVINSLTPTVEKL
jgi:hypothetical protein